MEALKLLALAAIAAGIFRLGFLVDKAIPVAQQFYESKVEEMTKNFYEAGHMIDVKLGQLDDCGDCGKIKNPAKDEYVVKRGKVQLRGARLPEVLPVQLPGRSKR